MCVLGVTVVVLGVTFGLFDGDDHKPRGPAGQSPSKPRDLRVLLAIDTSGSMNKPVSRDDSLKRIDAAIGGAQAGLGKVKPPYELGVWTFRQTGHTVLAQIAPATPTRLRSIVDKLGALRPGGSTPLYNTIDAGIEALQLAALRDDEPADTINALVILTDGKNNPPRAMRRAGTATTARELNSALADGGNIRVIVTAAFTKRCRKLFARVPALPEKNCLTVRSASAIKRRLSDILARLEKGRQKQ